MSEYDINVMDLQYANYHMNVAAWPWRFDNHGINDAEGQRMLKLWQGPCLREVQTPAAYTVAFGDTSRVIRAAPESLVLVAEMLTDCDKLMQDYRLHEVKPEVRDWMNRARALLLKTFDVQ
jgi:hypothetical protein